MHDLTASSTGRKLAIAFGPGKSGNILGQANTCQV
jgi:hypothetical protein